MKKYIGIITACVCLLVSCNQSETTLQNQNAESNSLSQETVSTSQKGIPKSTGESSNWAQRFVEIEEEFRKARIEFVDGYDAIDAQAIDQRKAFFEANYPDPARFAQQMLELSEETDDANEVFRALTWAHSFAPGTSQAESARDQLFEAFVTHAGMEKLCIAIGLDPWTQTTIDRLENVIDKSLHPPAKAAATYTLASILSQSLAVQKKVNEGQRPSTPTEIRNLEFAKQLDIDEAKIEDLYDSLETEFANLKIPQSVPRKYKDYVASVRFDRNRLQIGMEVPEIEGVDLENESFQLSDYRGQVVVVVFWGDWCRACQEMYTQENGLIEKLSQVPFTIVGINSDPSRELALKVKQEKNLRWRSFWDGKKGVNGPISTRWNIRSWPTVYVLDSRGTIRFKNIQGTQLEVAITDLLKEMGHDVEL
ncbi:MAG: TlpA disulfide reductase family protein [Planctomycetota bacterium]